MDIYDEIIYHFGHSSFGHYLYLVIFVINSLLFLVVASTIFSDI